MGSQLVRRLRRTVCAVIAWACDKLRVDWAEASRNQVEILKIGNPYRTVIAFRDEIHEAITVASLDVKLGIAPRHFSECEREVGRAESPCHSDHQLPAQKIRIVATTTLWAAPAEGNMPEQLFWRVAQRLAPAHAP